ncbi:cytochrome b561 [Loktanella fryxellensis]|uniref:Cytochrome b561 n=1 Tax=Loktanella fryxellensis TaxID=245187 RepID=A0A1H8KAD6_9RHOB|nr:cytochrome b561 [Loktanella fryxellensis]
MFYARLIVVPVTGLLGYYYGDPYDEWHTYAKPVFIGLIALHVAASLYHQFWRKEGRKRRLRPIGISVAGRICDEVSLTLSPS